MSNFSKEAFIERCNRLGWQASESDGEMAVAHIEKSSILIWHNGDVYCHVGKGRPHLIEMKKKQFLDRYFKRELYDLKKQASNF